jgi:hypothetical protein
MKALEILELYEMNIGTANKADVLKAVRLADDGGTLQPLDAAQLFSDPRRHTCMTLPTAFKFLGCVQQ